jgi:hypothetical protein
MPALFDVGGDAGIEPVITAENDVNTPRGVRGFVGTFLGQG